MAGEGIPALQMDQVDPLVLRMTKELLVYRLWEASVSLPVDSFSEEVGPRHSQLVPLYLPVRLSHVLNPSTASLPLADGYVSVRSERPPPYFLVIHCVRVSH